MTIGIYYIANCVNGRIYIGQSLHVERRLRQHRYALQAGRHPNALLQSDWLHMGASAFTLELLTSVAQPEQLLVHESWWIAFYHATDPRYGYNTDAPQVTLARRYPATFAALNAMGSTLGQRADALGLSERRYCNLLAGDLPVAALRRWLTHLPLIHAIRRDLGLDAATDAACAPAYEEVSDVH